MMIPDIFYPEDVVKLLNNKVVIFLGDSNMRAVYKDFITLTQKRSLITKNDLKTKMEDSYFGDKLVYHGQLCNGRDFKEERKFKCSETRGSYSFFFITRAYNSYVSEVLDLAKKQKPHVVVINSCLWDITRWGPSGVEEYKKNMTTLMKKLKHSLPSDCLIIWLTTAPITTHVYGGFLVQQLEFLRYSLRFHVMEANQYAHKVASDIGLDVLDIHYSLRMHLHLRADDGIHWQPPAVRHTTNSILTHISLAWGVPLPHRFPPQTAEEEEAIISAHPANKKKRKRRRRVFPYSQNNRLGQGMHEPYPFNSYIPGPQTGPINQLAFMPNFQPFQAQVTKHEAMRNALFPRNDGKQNLAANFQYCERYSQMEQEQFAFSGRGPQFSQSGPINQLAFMPNLRPSLYDEPQQYGEIRCNPYTHFYQTKRNHYSHWMP